MAVTTMQELFVEELRDIYHAEKQLVKALPKMAKAANDDELKNAIQLHLEETRGQVERLEQVFESIDVAKRGKTCEAMEGLLEEAQEMMKDVLDPEVRDAAMITAAQKVEHYEIASYGSLAALARQLGHGDAADLLAQTLGEEKAADEKLSKIALGRINAKPARKSRPVAAAV